MGKAVIPDNIHFYKKNSNNSISVNLKSLDGGEFLLDTSKSIGESEVAINLLGIPRSETRGVIYEDVSTYGLNPDRWTVKIEPDYPGGVMNNYPNVDPNAIDGYYNSVRRHKRRFSSSSNITIIKGVDQVWDPEGYDLVCPQYEVKQKDKYNLYDETFLPVIYHDKDASSIVMDGWPAEFGYYIPIYPPYLRCTPNTGSVISPAYDRVDNYKCTLESRETYRYEPGKIIGFTFGISTSVKDVVGINPKTKETQNKTAKWGVRNSTDAYYFLLDGTELKLVRESIYDQGNIVLTQKDFLDKLDGTGPSKASIDFSKVTMYSVEFSWYGAIGATFFVYLPTENEKTRWVKIGEIASSNLYPNPSLSDPYMKMFMELEIPWACKSPHFFKKYGTSVYMDGEGFNKETFAKSRSFTTPIKELDTNYYKNIFTIEIPEKSADIGISKYNRNKFNPINIEAFFDETCILTIDKVYDNSIKHFSAPTLILGLSAVEKSDKLYYDGSGEKNYSESSDGSYGGKPQPYSDSLYDYVLPVVGDHYTDTKEVKVYVPPEYDINDVVRSLLYNVPQIYIPRNIHRQVTDRLYPIYRYWYNYFNWVLGVEAINLVGRVENLGDRILVLSDFYESSFSGGCFSTDGILPGVLDKSHMDPFSDPLRNNKRLAVNIDNYPDYGPDFAGYKQFFRKPYGGNIDINTPIYYSDCKVVINKSYYRNNSCYIVSPKINTGEIYFQPPTSPYTVGFITESTLKNLSDQNYFLNKDFSQPGVYESKLNNIQKYLKDNSIIYNTKPIVMSLGSRAVYLWKQDQPYSSIYYDRGYLRSEWYHIHKESYIGEDIIGLPYSRSNSFTHLGDFSNKYSGKDNFGFEIRTYDVRLKLDPKKSSLRDTLTYYQVNFDDLQYLKDGAYTNSKEFWLLFLNNLKFINSNGSFKLNGVSNRRGGYEDSVTLDDLPVHWSRKIPPTNMFFYLRSPSSGLVDVKIRTISFAGLQQNIPSRQFYFYNFLNSLYRDDTGLFSTIVIPFEENLYFYMYINTDINVYNRNYLVNLFDQTSKGGFPRKYGNYASYFLRSEGFENDTYPYNSENMVNSFDTKFCFTRFDVKDKNGVKSNNLSPYFVYDFEVIKDYFVGDKDCLANNESYRNIYIKKSDITLKGTGNAQNYLRGKYLTSKIYLQDNDYTQNISTKNSNKTSYNFIIQKNVKTFIDLSYIFKQGGNSILPTLGSNTLPFNTYFTVKGRSLLNNNNKVKGIVSLNYEEKV